MTERKMEGWLLRDLADIVEKWASQSLAGLLRAEAARREAEAKEFIGCRECHDR